MLLFFYLFSTTNRQVLIFILCTTQLLSYFITLLLFQGREFFRKCLSNIYSPKLMPFGNWTFQTTLFPNPVSLFCLFILAILERNSIFRPLEQVQDFFSRLFKNRSNVFAIFHTSWQNPAKGGVELIVLSHALSV